MVPAIATLGAILLKFEKGTSLTFIGIIVCFVATAMRLFYDDLNDTYKGKLFKAKFYLFMYICFQVIGVLIQKKLLKFAHCSLRVLVFYIWASGFITSAVFYNAKYWNDTFNYSSSKETYETFKGVYFTFEYIWILLDIAMIYIALIAAESYRYMTLIWINKKGHISKVTMYYSLHGFFVVIIWLIFEKTYAFDYFFIAMITAAYIALYFSKYTMSRVLKSNQHKTKERVQFKRTIKELEEVNLFESASRISIDGNYFYSSTQKLDQTRALVLSGSGSDNLGNSNLSNSDLGQKQALIRSAYDKYAKKTNLLAGLPNDEIIEESDEEDVMLDDENRDGLEQNRGMRTAINIDHKPIDGQYVKMNNGNKEKFKFSISDSSGSSL